MVNLRYDQPSMTAAEHVRIGHLVADAVLAGLAIDVPDSAADSATSESSSDSGDT